jgi:uncharacterized damage-inducible protein DinB
MAHQVPQVLEGGELTEVARISAELQRMYEGPAWHGPGVLESIKDVTAEQANARVAANAHTIYEITHHIAAWIGEVRSRLQGKPSGNPADGDWPPAETRVSDGEWQRARDRLETRHADLLATLSSFDATRLGERVDPAREGPEGLATFYILLHGLVQHNAYHAGQIMLVRRALGA